VSAGTYPYQVTLTGGTWPAWAAYGALRIGDLNYEVARRVSDTIVLLREASASPADIAAGTTYQLYRDTYTMPEDFVTSDKPYAESMWGGLQYVHPSVLLQASRYASVSANAPHYYTYLGDPLVANRLAIRFYPYPEQVRTLDFIYKRRCRAVTLWEYATGTVTVDASSGATQLVTGLSTAWTAAMAGSVLRLSADTQNLPTSLAGSNPAAAERNLAVYGSATSYLTDDSLSVSYTAVPYRLSDPIDIEEGTMLEAFHRCCEKHMAILGNKKDKADAVRLYDLALLRAREADVRHFRAGAAGMTGAFFQRLAAMPRGADVS
jgi:hypothetical protein